MDKYSEYLYRAIVVLICVISLSGCEEAKPEYNVEVILNPFDIAPLTAAININAENPFKASYKVLGANPIEQKFEDRTNILLLPVVGLYPSRTNKVVVNLEFSDKKIIDTILIKTARVPDVIPRIEINKIDRSRMEPGFHGCDIHYANQGKFRSIPMIFDDQGVVRWYLDLSFANQMVSPLQRINNGNLLMKDRYNIYQFNMLGQKLKQIKVDENYGMHHDVIELPNDDLLICVGTRDSYINIDGEKILSDSDYVVHFDTKKNKVVKEWDLAKHLDVSRDDLNFFGKGDWLHMNGLAFNKKDSTITVSAKNQGLINISWDDKLNWILSPKNNWGKSGREGRGIETAPYLLTALDSKGNVLKKSVQDGITTHEEFDFPWGPHAPEILPNGNILVFDNGTYREYNHENNYSRAVEYSINESDLTVSQVWQYGKERNEDFFSSIVSDVDLLPQTKNILVSSGFINPKAKYAAKIVEVDYATKEEIFEATLYYKTLNGDKSGGWGQSDILYRSERFDLRY